METKRLLVSSLSLTDPFLSRTGELVAKHIEPVPTLWLKPPGDTALHLGAQSQFWQPWYPEHQRLLKTGWKSGLGELWAQIVLFGGRQKEENRNLLELARQHLEPQGKILFAVPNEYGSKSYQKQLEEDFSALNYFSGRKSRLYIFQNDHETRKSLDFTIQNQSGFSSQAGLFSWDRIDRGSALLVKALKMEKIRGPICDLGAGWGFLSSSLTSNSSPLHLLEADSRGLDMAKVNLGSKVASYHWADATDIPSLPSELVGSMGTVVTNPPFHTGKKAEPILGGAFVASAHKLLKKRGGALYLVGNSHLPYRRILQAFFSEVKELQRQDGYQVWKAE